MALSAAQLALLRTAVQAAPMYNPAVDTPDANAAIAAYLNQVASPDVFGWRTRVMKNEITNKTSDLPSNFSWVTFISRSLLEHSGWREMFDGGNNVNPSQFNVRKGFRDVFGTAVAGNTQCDHIWAICRRKLTRYEAIYATTTATDSETGNSGTVGAAGNPKTLGVDADGLAIESPITGLLVGQARNISSPSLSPSASASSSASGSASPSASVSPSIGL